MEKPVQLVYSEFVTEMTEVVNKYVPKLPAFIMFNFLNTLQTQLNGLSEQQLIQAKTLYEKGEEDVKEENN